MRTSSITAPLVIDLDGTLIRTDMLYETVNQRIKHNPLSFLSLIPVLSKGKNRLKEKLAIDFKANYSELPINEDLLAWLKEEKKSGRKFILASGSHETVVHQAATYFGFFDEVYATNTDVNLTSTNKKDLLIEKFGDKGYDYIGDSSVDKPVWQSARYTYAVHPSAKTLKWLQNNTDLKQVFNEAKKNKTKGLLKAMRPHQWAKNALIFIPLFSAHLYALPEYIWASLLAFVVFSLTASSVYILNDLLDVEDDRRHPRKCKRPFASGQLSILSGWLAWPILLSISVGLSILTLPKLFWAILGLYYITTTAYSFYFKRRPLIDVLILASLYTLRVVAGTVALSVHFSFWLLSFSMFIFLSLAFMKRVSEFMLITNDAGLPSKLLGRGYIQSDFEIISSMGISSGFLSVVFLALYVQSDDVASLYKCPELIWLTCPLLLYWVARAWLITHRGLMHDDPVVFALKDKMSWLIFSLFFLIFFLARIWA